MKPKRRMLALQKGTESARVSPASHCCSRLGGVARSQLLQRPSGQGDPPARAHRRVRSSVTLRAASPLLWSLANPQDQVGRRLPAGSHALGGFVKLPRKPGRPGEGDLSSGSREGKKAGESRSRAALHAEVSLLNRLEL